METKKKIAIYQFTDSINQLKATIVGHVLIFIVFLFYFDALGWFHPRIEVVLITILCFALLYFLYDFKNNPINGLILLAYYGLFGYEMATVGIPKTLLSYEGISKGIMMEILVAMAPYIYVGLRIGLILPLFKLILARRKVINQGL